MLQNMNLFNLFLNIIHFFIKNANTIKLTLKYFTTCGVKILEKKVV